MKRHRATIWWHYAMHSIFHVITDLIGILLALYTTTIIIIIIVKKNLHRGKKKTTKQIKQLKSEETAHKEWNGIFTLICTVFKVSQQAMTILQSWSLESWVLWNILWPIWIVILNWCLLMGWFPAYHHHIREFNFYLFSYYIHFLWSNFANYFH